MQRVYFDNNASAPLHPAAREAMLAALERMGNPSSVHGEGRFLRGIVNNAREAVAAMACVQPQQVIFTSSATEANALALQSHMELAGKSAFFDRLLVSAVEHPSVLSGGSFLAEKTGYIPVTAQGVLDISALENRLREAAKTGEKLLVSVMAVNSETGGIQPVAEIGAMLANYDTVFHVDAAQAAGKIDCAPFMEVADYLTLSAHKMGGAVGAGALILRNENRHPKALFIGGGQEKNRRAGTENVAALAAFGAVAARHSELTALYAGTQQWRDEIETFLLEQHPDLFVFGHEASRVAGVSNFAVPGMAAETALIALDLAGIAVSTGSACSSGKVETSHVLRAMGVEESLAQCALRLSLGWQTSERDIAFFKSIWQKSIALLRRV